MWGKDLNDILAKKKRAEVAGANERDFVRFFLPRNMPWCQAERITALGIRLLRDWRGYGIDWGIGVGSHPQEIEGGHRAGRIRRGAGDAGTGRSACATRIRAESHPQETRVGTHNRSAAAKQFAEKIFFMTTLACHRLLSALNLAHLGRHTAEHGCATRLFPQTIKEIAWNH